MPKGEHPNSQQNLIAGKNKKPNPRKTLVQISDKARELAKKTGDGNMAEGVEQSLMFYAEMNQDRLFAQSPVFTRVKNLVEAIASSDSEFSVLAEVLLYDLEDLLIEESHKEAVLGSSQDGAYIV